MATKGASYEVYSWNTKKQNWDLQSTYSDLTKARNFAKKESEIYSKRFKVDKIEHKGIYEKGKDL